MFHCSLDGKIHTVFEDQFVELNLVGDVAEI